jgi:hypothetical protein
VVGERTPQRDQRPNGVRSAPGQIHGVESAEAPPDQAHRAALSLGGQQLVEAVCHMATEPAVLPESPAVAAVAELREEPSQPRRGGIGASQPWQHQHRVTVTTGQHRQQRAGRHREGGELRGGPGFPGHRGLPAGTLRHVPFCPVGVAMRHPRSRGRRHSVRRRERRPRVSPVLATVWSSTRQHDRDAEHEVVDVDPTDDESAGGGTGDGDRRDEPRAGEQDALTASADVVAQLGPSPVGTLRTRGGLATIRSCGECAPEPSG